MWWRLPKHPTFRLFENSVSLNWRVFNDSTMTRNIHRAALWAVARGKTWNFHFELQGFFGKAPYQNICGNNKEQIPELSFPFIATTWLWWQLACLLIQITENICFVSKFHYKSLRFEGILAFCARFLGQWRWMKWKLKVTTQNWVEWMWKAWRRATRAVHLWESRLCVNTSCLTERSYSTESWMGVWMQSRRSDGQLDWKWFAKHEDVCSRFGACHANRRLRRQRNAKLCGSCKSCRCSAFLNFRKTQTVFRCYSPCFVT